MKETRLFSKERITRYPMPVNFALRFIRQYCDITGQKFENGNTVYIVKDASVLFTALLRPQSKMITWDEFNTLTTMTTIVVSESRFTAPEYIVRTNRCLSDDKRECIYIAITPMHLEYLRIQNMPFIKVSDIDAEFIRTAHDLCLEKHHELIK